MKSANLGTEGNGPKDNSDETTKLLSAAMTANSKDQQEEKARIFAEAVAINNSK